MPHQDPSNERKSCLIKIPAMRGLLLSATDKKEISYRHKFVKRSITGYATMFVAAILFYHRSEACKKVAHPSVFGHNQQYALILMSRPTPSDIFSARMPFVLWGVYSGMRKRLSLYSTKVAPTSTQGLFGRASPTAPTPASAGVLPNGHFLDGSSSKAPKNKLYGALLPRWSQKRVAPPGSTPVLPALPSGGHAREAEQRRRSEAQRDGVGGKTGRRWPKAAVGQGGADASASGGWWGAGGGGTEARQRHRRGVVLE
jgi:hypothetical protein